MRVAILGCGYVGLELGRRLLDAGHDVVGVRRSDDGLAAVEDEGLVAVSADVTDAESLGRIPDVDAIVFAASAGGRDAEAARATYVEGLRTVVEQFGSREERPERLLYTSSTGVYGNHDGNWVDEDTPLEPVDDYTAALIDAERVALVQAPATGIDPTVVRLGGIYGPERFRLERYLEGPVTAGYTNLVHRADAAGILQFLLTSDLGRGDVVVGVDDEPVDRWELGDWLADQCGRDPPPKQTIEDRLDGMNPSAGRARRIRANKRCSNAKLRELGYDFTYQTYREGLSRVLYRYKA